MGTWSAEPIGNDAAADFVAELDGERRWTVVKATFATAAKLGDPLDSDTAATAIAAAEVVAHGLGRPTQTDAYTESIQQFVGRARRPSRGLADRAIQAVHDAARPNGGAHGAVGRDRVERPARFASSLARSARGAVSDGLTVALSRRRPAEQE